MSTKGISAAAKHTEGLFAQVAIDEALDRTLTYRVPQHLADKVAMGKLVEVPVRNQRCHGCIVGLAASPGDVPLDKLRDITKIITPDFQIDHELLELGQWISQYYIAPIGQTLACISFLGFNWITSHTQAVVQLQASPSSSQKLTPKQQLVIDYLISRKGVAPIAEIREQLRISESVIGGLIKKGLVERKDLVLTRHDDFGFDSQSGLSQPLVLNSAQAEALGAIVQQLELSEYATFLLHGVTGSGKTEVYLQTIDQALALGGTAIVLVPEIALTPQTVARFRTRFGRLVGVYHSRLTLGQKYDLWHQIRRGEVRILIGARSAVFAPLPNLKIIVVDEEHEQSYKQETTPRYHARDVAIYRAHRCGAVVVLGSATPNVESYYKALEGKFRLLRLPERIDNRPLPSISVIDLTQRVQEELDLGIFTHEAHQKMQEALDSGYQVIVFLNRRGFFNFALCVSCKKTLRCSNCDVALTYHKVGDRLVCHYCGRSEKRPTHCPYCEEQELTMVGLGTQRVEEELARLFPDRRIVRIDLDTMAQRTAYLKTWRLLEQGEVDIIVGTQMIARGIHLERVALVVVPLADVSLFQPDFRATERAFALLTQVAGRAGRGDAPGKVLIQTYVPYHYAIQFAQNHDYEGFYQKEIHIRRVLRFPPFRRLIGILGQADKYEVGERLFRQFVDELQNVSYSRRDEVSVLGPTPAPLQKLHGKYRWRALMRGGDPWLMREIAVAAIERFRSHKGHSRIEIAFDVDPYDLL